jgi:hypothetical protein
MGKNTLSPLGRGKGEGDSKENINVYLAIA